MTGISMLEHFLKTTFSVEGSYDYESVKRVLNHPSFPNREKEFKKELIEAVVNHSISVKAFEQLTDISFDTQEEVTKFLTDEIWKPLYGDEPIKV